MALFVEEYPDENVSLGVERVEECKKCVYAIEAHLLHSLTEDEQQTFINLLVKVNQGLKDAE